MLYLYRLIFWLAAPAVLGYTLTRALRDGGKRYMWQRIALDLPRLKRPIWLHCASVGEVNACRPLLDLIATQHPHTGIIVTTNTTTGREVVTKIKIDNLHHAYLPLDFPGCVKRFFARINPRCALILETELWPNLFYECHRHATPLVIVNGRLTPRTLNAPGLIRGNYRQALTYVQAILARSDADKARFLSLGAKPDQVLTLGNIKFARRSNSEMTTPINPVTRPYWLAASTHADEELRIARVWKKISQPNYLLVIAPRHPDRREAVIKQLNSLQLNVAVRSRNEPLNKYTQVYLADTLGEMPMFMTHADFVFLGGSLIERGGQNILEPARLGKAIIVGPHMENFAEESDTLLANGAMIMVQDDAHLYQKISELMMNSSLRDELGQNAKQVIKQREDIANTYYEQLQNLGVFSA